MPIPVELVLSVVSHGQKDLVRNLIDDLKEQVRTAFRLVITENIPESFDLDASKYPFEIEILRNQSAKGFAANHNAALARSDSCLFCVLNPDIRLRSNPFPALIALARKPEIGVAGPLVLGPDLSPEDHARRFPSVYSLAAKLVGWTPRMSAREGQDLFYPDWIAGMFMVSRTETLRAIGGFDERYFLYYEDVDLCARLRSLGLEVVVNTQVSVVHNARRQSRRNPVYLWWHLCSAARFLASRPGIALGLQRRTPPAHIA